MTGSLGKRLYIVTPEIKQKLRDFITRILRLERLEARAIILFGSATFRDEVEDLDVVVFVDRYLEPQELEELKWRIKSVWDAEAIARGWPPLDIEVYSGYEELRR